MSRNQVAEMMFETHLTRLGSPSNHLLGLLYQRTIRCIIVSFITNP